MKTLIAPALLGIVAAAAPAQAHHARHHHHRAAMVYPDSVTMDGKEYKVCKAGMEDDCIQPRQAGLGFGNRPTDAHHPGKMDQHR